MMFGLRQRKAFLVVSAVFCLLLVGCGRAEPSRDAAGETLEQATARSFKEQYAIAGKRHRELNELFAELQREIVDDNWGEGAVFSEVIPLQGSVLGGTLAGDNRENSYYFRVSRWYPGSASLQPQLRKLSAMWEKRGWSVSADTSKMTGEVRVVGETPEGYRFLASDESGTLLLSGRTPVYWGHRSLLSGAAADRRGAEDAAGATWDTDEEDENGRFLRMPGVYRPFPAWDAVPEPARDPKPDDDDE